MANKSITRSLLGVLLCLCILFSMCFPAYANEGEQDSAQMGLCVHHPEHTDQCGYTPAVAGAACTHTHEDADGDGLTDCGYIPASEGVPCNHVHDESCGYRQAVEGTACDQGCQETDGSGNVLHAEGCAYTPGTPEIPCTHSHGETCSYIAPTAGQSCTHTHGEACGYAEPTEGTSCRYAVEGCPECMAKIRIASQEASQPVPPINPNVYSYTAKTAEALENNWSKVTLTVGQTATSYDIVFVMDNNSWLAGEKKQALETILNNMITALGQADAEIKIGAVKYQQTPATANFPLTSLSSFDWTKWNDFLDNQKAPFQEIGGPQTATNAGLIAAKQILDGDTTVVPGNKYVVFINNDLTHAWVDNFQGTYKAYCVNYANQDKNIVATNATAWAWAAKYGEHRDDMSHDPGVGGWPELLGATAQNIEIIRSQYATCYASTGFIDIKPAIDYGTEAGKNLPTTNEVGYYMCYLTWQEMVNAGYQTFAAQMDSNLGPLYPFNNSFLAFLNGGTAETLDTILNKIERQISGKVVDKGSYVTDYIGCDSAQDGSGYDFDFVNEAAALTMKVGSTVLTPVPLGENQYGFGTQENGSYPYVLTYSPNDSQGESFKWEFNVAVQSLSPIQLTYHVELKKAPTKEGEHTLYTNTSATLTPVDSNGTVGTPVTFARPYVTYTPPQKRTITVSKIWKDGDNFAGIRPESVTIRLLADGVQTDKVLTLNAAGNWTGSFTDLEVKNKKGEIVYTVQEDTVTGYYDPVYSEICYAQDGNGSVTVTNTIQYAPPTGIALDNLPWRIVSVVSILGFVLLRHFRRRTGYGR